MSEGRAELLALEVLAFLAADADVLARFAEQSGFDIQSIRDRAAEPDFLASILEFLLADEVLVVDFCDTASTDARDLHMAQHLLSGA